jgi:hypothetical protein
MADRNAVSFEPDNFPLFRLRHQNFELKVAKPDGSDQFQKDATFLMIPGLEGTDASFRSFNFPDRFVRHQNFVVFLHTNAGPSFAEDATWKVLVQDR